MESHIWHLISGNDYVRIRTLQKQLIKGNIQIRGICEYQNPLKHYNAKKYYTNVHIINPELFEFRPRTDKISLGTLVRYTQTLAKSRKKILSEML